MDALFVFKNYYFSVGITLELQNTAVSSSSLLFLLQCLSVINYNVYIAVFISRDLIGTLKIIFMFLFTFLNICNSIKTVLIFLSTNSNVSANYRSILIDSSLYYSLIFLPFFAYLVNFFVVEC